MVPDGGGGRWFPMALRRLPGDGADLPAAGDLVVIDVAPPPGAVTGASVDLPALDAMGLRSGPAWYSYIAGRSLVWLPGKTRRPVPSGGRYGWSSNPADYPVLHPGRPAPLRVRRSRHEKPHAQRHPGAVGEAAGPGAGGESDRHADRHTRVAPAASGGRDRPAERPRRRTQPGKKRTQPGKNGALNRCAATNGPATQAQ